MAQTIVPQMDINAILNIGKVASNALNKVSLQEAEDAKLKFERDRYNTQLGFQQRAEQRDIDKIATENERLLSTNNALSALNNPNSVTSLNTAASETTTNNLVNSYNKFNADGVISPQEQAMIDKQYQSDLYNDVMTSGSVDQSVIFKARQDMEKAKLDELEFNANLDFKQQQLNLQRQNANMQNRIANAQLEQIDSDKNAAMLFLNSLKPTTVTEDNPQYLSGTRAVTNTKNELANIEKSLSPNILGVSPDIAKEFMQERDRLKSSQSAPTLDVLGDGSSTPTNNAPVVNEKLLASVGGDMNVYNTLMSGNNAEKVQGYYSQKNQLPIMESNLAQIPRTKEKTLPVSTDTVIQNVLNDESIKDPIAKMEIINQLSSDGGLGSLSFGSSGKGSSRTSSIFGSNDTSSVAEKKYKRELQVDVAKSGIHLDEIVKKNPNMSKQELLNLKQYASDPKILEEYIKVNYNQDFTKKNSSDMKVNKIESGLGSLLSKDDTDSDSSQNINEFMVKNKDILSKLSTEELDNFMSKVSNDYTSQSKSSFKNVLGHSPLGDALDNAVKNWNKANPNKQLKSLDTINW